MIELIYDSCFLCKGKPFGLASLQTNNTLMLMKDIFVIAKKEDIMIAKFMTKKRACFLSKMSIKFNSTYI